MFASFLGVLMFSVVISYVLWVAVKGLLRMFPK